MEEQIHADRGAVEDEQGAREERSEASGHRWTPILRLAGGDEGERRKGVAEEGAERSLALAAKKKTAPAGAVEGGRSRGCQSLRPRSCAGAFACGGAGADRDSARGGGAGRDSARGGGGAE